MLFRGFQPAHFPYPQRCLKLTRRAGDLWSIPWCLFRRVTAFPDNVVLVALRLINRACKKRKTLSASPDLNLSIQSGLLTGKRNQRWRCEQDSNLQGRIDLTHPLSKRADYQLSHRSIYVEAKIMTCVAEKAADHTSLSRFPRPRVQKIESGPKAKKFTQERSFRREAEMERW